MSNKDHMDIISSMFTKKESVRNTYKTYSQELTTVGVKLEVEDRTDPDLGIMIIELIQGSIHASKNNGGRTWIYPRGSWFFAHQEHPRDLESHSIELFLPNMDGPDPRSTYTIEGISLETLLQFKAVL